ncbi:TetR/AcrR family transcriptional regulator [Frankia sp. QA3]|uniref:TetR/AcrR family transcriptional regulator n=1 Tax=Frankia sp. QA3 TaxID=710111 RepID=UPI000269BBE3|nr:TetR/AcrR family transcriptional regulator [Frankia sp. QA3]EIV92180.1 transcriptional regulator [Frankia sp. QA3]
MGDTRTRLLDAATEVMLTAGVEQFTLAAVAERASVSKGGLLYHFPSKQALVAALVDRLVSRFDTALRTAGPQPGSATRAYLAETVEPTATAVGADTDRVTVAVLAAALVDPETLAPLREVYAAWQRRLEADGVDPAAATAVRLAVDGWWLARLLDLAPPTGDVHERTYALLAHLIERT